MKMAAPNATTTPLAATQMASVGIFFLGSWGRRGFCDEATAAPPHAPAALGRHSIDGLRHSPGSQRRHVPHAQVEAALL